MKQYDGLRLGSVLILCCLAIAVSAQDGKGVFYTAEFRWEEVYEDWGPAIYYGERVKVAYESLNHWIYYGFHPLMLGEHLYQLSGSATIYKWVNGAWVLFDTQPFGAYEEFFDLKPIVAEKRTSPQGNTWYQVSHLWTHPELNKFRYIWVIGPQASATSGLDVGDLQEFMEENFIYIFIAQNTGGNWNYHWFSGGQSGGDQGAGSTTLSVSDVPSLVDLHSTEDFHQISDR